MRDRTKRVPVEQEERIDIVNSMVKGWKVFSKTWFMMIILVIAAALASFMYNRFLFVPEYQAYSTFTVTSGSATGAVSTYYSTLSLNQIDATFPYILESSTLKDVVAEELGMDSLSGITIEAKAVEDSGFLWIGVTAGDPDTAYEVLNAVIENYPVVARYIIGDTVITSLDSSGVPTSPSNGVSEKNSLKRGAIIGLILYLLILATLTAARKTVNSEEDLKQYTSAKCLASIPQVVLKRRSGNRTKALLIDQKHMASSFIESVSALRVRTKRRLGEDRKTVLITSTTESEGKTTITCNLALSYAMKGYRVLIIDADLRHPAVCTYLGSEQQVGLASVLTGQTLSGEAVKAYASTSLYYISGTEPVNAASVSGLLSGRKMQELISDAREKYDYIFIDTPPVGVMQDAAIVAAVCDCSIMVIRQDHLSISQIVDNLEILNDTDAELIGYVINRESTGVGSYGYGRYGYGKYGYGKSSKYGKYGYGDKESKKQSKRAAD